MTQLLLPPTKKQTCRRKEGGGVVHLKADVCENRNSSHEKERGKTNLYKY